MRRIAAALGLLTAIGGPAAAQTAPPLSAPGDQAVMTLEAHGVQVYECRDTAAGLAWVFREPRAQLYRDGRMVGRHVAGPSWEYEDGSRITGAVQASRPAPAATDIPWLRLAVSSHGGSGLLGPVTAVQRINTQGGVVSGPCPAVGAINEAPYGADYVMLRTAP